MKNIAIAAFAAMLFFSSCGSNDSSEDKSEGSEQVQDPVLNSGPETEQERATDAVRDSTIRTDSNAQSMPH